MIYTKQKSRLQRQRVIVVSHPDGFLEVFAESHIDVHLVRVPVTHTPEGEQIADDLTEMLLPRLYRSLYRADRLRATGTTRPLLPSVMARSRVIREEINVLNKIASLPAGEAVVLCAL